MLLWVRRRPHAERSGRFRLSLGDVVFRSSPVHREGTCNVRSLRCLLLQCAGMSCNTRIFLCRFLLCADVPSGVGCPACRHFRSIWVACQVRLAQWIRSSSPTAFLPPLPPSPDKEVSEPLQAPVADRISDVPESSQDDPQDVLEYEQPIHELFLREHLARQPLGTCLICQPQLNAKMRAILFDWLVDVAANYKLRPLFLFGRSV